MAFVNQCYYLMCTTLILFVLGYCVCNALSSRPNLDSNVTLSMRERHERWMTTYNRTYKNLAEKEKRFNIFKENIEYIEHFNRASLSNHILYTLGENEFVDLTNEEFIATYTGSKPLLPLQSMILDATTTNFKHANITNIPSSMDWREKGVVTSIQNQKKCGSCWAISSVAAVEGLNKINNGILIPLSTQQLIDCDQRSNGCKNGKITNALKFIQENGILTDQVYPYKAIQGKCQNNLQGQRVRIKGFEKVPTRNEDALLQAVSKQPVAAHVNSFGFKFYKGGIYNGQCRRITLNHVVTIVGYGTENGNDYWLLKNSWGPWWGERGYMRIIRGRNMCGIATQAYYPI